LHVICDDVENKFFFFFFFFLLNEYIQKAMQYERDNKASAALIPSNK